MDSLLGNLATKVFHGNNDHVTNKWAAETIGQTFQEKSSYSIGTMENASFSKALHYQVEPQEFTLLRGGGQALEQRAQLHGSFLRPEPVPMSGERKSDRPFRRRSYADEDRLRGLVDEVYRFSEKRYPFLVGTVVWFFRQVGKSLAFTLKVFLRRDMGVRTYGVGLMAEAFFVHKFYLFLTLAIYAEFSFMEFAEVFVPGSDTWNAFWDIVVFWWPDQSYIDRATQDERTAYLFRHMPFWFGYFYLLMCLGSLPAKFRQIAKPRRTHSYAGGESVLFGWLQKLGMSEQTVLMAVEPAFVFVLGIFFMALDDIYYDVFGDLLMTGSVALFFEEYLPHARRRRIVQDRIDAQFEMAKIEDLAALMEPEAASSAKRVPAALADEKDAERYKAEMERQSGKSKTTI